MTVRFVSGDLFVESESVSLGHGCNCAGAMGKGIAVAFKKQNPRMYEAYKVACADGTLQVGGVLPWQRDNGTWIYNLGTQRTWRTKARLPDVEAALRAALNHATANGVDTIRMPAVGAGLGGLSWAAVRGAIQDVFAASSVELVVYAEYVAGRSAVPLA